MHPNLVLINVGTNDCLRNVDTPNAGARIKILIDYLFSAVPSTTIILSTILPSKTVDGCVQNVNDQYKALMSQYTGRRIVIADMHAHMTVADISDDGVHPNAFGYKKMASVWWGAFQQIQDQIQPPDNSVDDSLAMTSNTCAKVAGSSAGPVQTQQGSGADDGPYVHSSVSRGSLLTIPDVGSEFYHFAQLVNLGGADRGGETDELIITAKQADSTFRYAYRLNSGGSYASTWTNFSSPVTCSGNVGE